MTKEENILDGLFEEFMKEPNKEIRFMGYRDVINQFKDQISEAKNNNNFQDFVIYSRILGAYRIKITSFENSLTP